MMSRIFEGFIPSKRAVRRFNHFPMASLFRWTHPPVPCKPFSYYSSSTTTPTTAFAVKLLNPVRQRASLSTLSPVGENLASKYKSGVFDSDLTVIKNHAIEEDEVEIKCGDIVNLNDLLFTEDRDYLVKYNENQRVKAEELEGKVVVIYFVSLGPDTVFYYPENERKRELAKLVDMYNYLKPKNDFEVVFVAVDTCTNHDTTLTPSHQDEKNFEVLFSGMPWTAIPFSDKTSRERLKRRFCFSRYLNTMVVVDSTRKVLPSKNDYYNCSYIQYCYQFIRFGALGYPFNEEKLNSLDSEQKEAIKQYGELGYYFSNGRLLSVDSEDDKSVKKPSLKRLMASPDRDYVISNNGDKVPIDTLEDKVVALYFYEDGITNDGLTMELMKAYEDLAQTKENFEVVLIYLSYTDGTLNRTNEKSFWRKFNTMPWLALPFKDPVQSKLMDTFGYHEIGLRTERPSIRLIIFGPNGSFVDKYGEDVLLNYKVPAYPFSREKAVKLETENIKKFKLENLWDLNTVFRGKDGSHVHLSQLVGKRIIFLFDYCFYGEYLESLLTLKERYMEMKGTSNEFEVIHMKNTNEPFKPNIYEKYNFPWLTYPLDESYSLPSKLLLHCSNVRKGYCAGPERDGWISSFLLVAFERDGSLVRRTFYPRCDYKDYPFYDGNLEEETWVHLNRVFGWCSSTA